MYLSRNLENDKEKSSIKRPSNLQRLLSKLSTTGSHLIRLDIEIYALTSREVAQMIYERLSKASMDDASISKSGARGSISEKMFCWHWRFQTCLYQRLAQRTTGSWYSTSLLAEESPSWHSAMLFLPVCDSTGTTQDVVEKSKVPYWAELSTLRSESKHYCFRNDLSLSGWSRDCCARSDDILRLSRVLHPEIQKLDRDLLTHHNTE